MKRIALLAVALLMTLVHNAYAGWETQTVGANGYDVVAYQTESKAARGDTMYSAYHNDTVYLFSSEANKKTFAQNPERYLPAYGGYCAYGMANGYKVPVDPQAFSVVDGRLYLNFNLSVQSEWRKNPAELITRADGNWAKIRSEKPAE